MQHFLQGKKHAGRKAFCDSIFNMKFSYPYSPVMVDALKILNLDVVKLDYKERIQLAHTVSTLVSYTQYAMINQETETQNQIVNMASDKLIEFLKMLHADFVPEDTGES